MVLPRADALTPRTTTYREVRAVSDPSQLGSDPRAATRTAAWRQGSCARTNDRGCARVSRAWAARHRTGSQQKTTHRGAATRVRCWCCGLNSRSESIKEEDVHSSGARGQGALPQLFGFTRSRIAGCADACPTTHQQRQHQRPPEGSRRQCKHGHYNEENTDNNNNNALSAIKGAGGTPFRVLLLQV